MAFLSGQLFIKTSSIPYAGKGLFTRKPIPKGTRIIEYKGRMSTWKEVDHQSWTNGYIFYIDRNHVVNAATYKKALGRFANDARGLYRVKGLKNNAEYVPEGSRVYIDATRDIPAGAEILVDYGKEYWDVIRYNQKILK
jgi:SET domain-containing protein